ncbi:hypothetical protein Tco_1549137 [Tanacetum coccineum]
MIEQDAYNVLMKNYDKLEQHCISLELAMQLNQENFQQNNSCENKDSLTFNQIFEVNHLKVRLKDNGKTIKKLKKEIKNLTKTTRDVEEIETINIELEHKVTKLLKENKHLKQTYAQLHDSINPLRVQEKEQCQALVDQLNKKSVDISDLNAKLQDKVLVIETLKNDLRTVKGKEIVNNASVTNCSAPIKYPIDPVTIAPRDRNNRDAHTRYLKLPIQQAKLLRDIVEESSILIH